MQTNFRNRPLLWVLGAAMLLLLAACGTQATPTFDLSVTVAGAGNGVVTSDPAGIDTAAGDDSFAFDEGTEVTLTATEEAGSDFDGWTGCDTTTGASCTVTVDAATTVTATFVVQTTPTYTLDVTVVGEGSVVSTPAGIDTATGDDSFAFDEATEVTLTATPGTDYSFDAWTGVTCDSTTADSCTLTMNAATSVTATFEQVAGSVSVAISTGTDDAEELVNGSGADSTTFPAGHTYTHSGDLEMTYDDGGEPGAQMIGLRFQSIDVPAGATITSASITFTADGNSNGAVTVTIAGEATADPVTFNDDPDTTASNDVSTRPLTTAEVTWTPGDWIGNVTYATDDLSTIVEEIVDLAGWTAGNSMAFIIDGPDAAPLRRAFSFDYSTGNLAAVLAIDWELPAP